MALCYPGIYKKTLISQLLVTKIIILSIIIIIIKSPGAKNDAQN